MITLKRNDLLPIVDVSLEAPAGTAVNLTGATVKFLMTLDGEDEPTVDASATVVDATAGRVTYEWQEGDTDTAGLYRAEFEVTFAGGKPRTFPQHGHLYITINPDLG